MVVLVNLCYSTLGYFIFFQTRSPINKVLKLQNEIPIFETWPQKHWSNLIEWNMLKAMQMWFCGPLRLLCKKLTSFSWVVTRLQLLTIKFGCLWMFMWQQNGKDSPFVELAIGGEWCHFGQLDCHDCAKPCEIWRLK
jgi:hypothetical protein